MAVKVPHYIWNARWKRWQILFVCTVNESTFKRLGPRSTLRSGTRTRTGNWKLETGMQTATYNDWKEVGDREGCVMILGLSYGLYYFSRTYRLEIQGAQYFRMRPPSSVLYTPEKDRNPRQRTGPQWCGGLEAS